MPDVPEHVRALAEERRAARAARDFGRADALRAQIAGAGFVVRDSPEGFTLEPVARFSTVNPASIPSILGEPPTLDVSVHLLHEGYPDDLERFLAGLGTHCDLSSAEAVVVDNASDDGDRIEEILGAHRSARAIHLDRALGWAAARNAGLRTSRGRILVLADLSVEPAGDVLTPLVRALDDPAVGIVGPFGLVSADMRSWQDSPGPEVDALEGYLMATRRELLADEQIHEKFKWYRNADIDLSFQIRALGPRALVVAVPLERHTHRGWSAVDEAERAQRSKRNHYTFFDRWKGRPDLLLANRG